jgi:hypothetical protein
MNNNNLNTERSASGVSEAHLLGWIRRTGSEVDLSYRTAIQYVGWLCVLFSPRILSTSSPLL